MVDLHSVHVSEMFLTGMGHIFLIAGKCNSLKDFDLHSEVPLIPLLKLGLPLTLILTTMSHFKGHVLDLYFQ